MKKRTMMILAGLVVILGISLVLFNREANLNYGDITDFCYEIQQAGHLISPDPEAVKEYTVKTDRYGNLILEVTGNEGERVSCEMTPDCQIIDKIVEINALKYLYAVISIAVLLMIIAVIKEYTKKRIGT